MVRMQAHLYTSPNFRLVVELEYTSGLSPDAERIEGSNPSESTCQPFQEFVRTFFFGKK